MPAGLSIAHPSSRCPKCQTPIRGRDNIPVFSWLLLKGRCRACGLGIAARYPKVEAFVGLVFGLMAYASVVSARADVQRANEFGLLLFYLAALQFALIGMFLIHFDRNTIPKSLSLVFVCIGILLPIAAYHLVDSWNSLGDHYLTKLISNLVGALLVGVSLGRCSSQGGNLLAIALVASSFRGIESVVYAGALVFPTSFFCRKVPWILAFSFSTIVGLDATYYIVNQNSLTEIIPTAINKPLCLFLIILFAIGPILELVGRWPRADES